ncbi:MAG: hypothetical protein BJ554DRAFT_2570 [Olpidium bornovanus]|uniref:Uncharacterized protein n=1 Tax=Olpidium bornovanus TaxID=278681 RepID=A0A8H8A0Z1_9FUNG|nr:MAG: hypothetical protein BJ554DRAFT_2570 [Olpidium bornovanus]
MNTNVFYKLEIAKQAMAGRHGSFVWAEDTERGKKRFAVRRGDGRFVPAALLAYEDAVRLRSGFRGSARAVVCSMLYRQVSDGVHRTAVVWCSGLTGTSLVDLAPYCVSQQFRMIGCGKRGKCPLRAVAVDDDWTPRGRLLRDGEAWDFAAITRDVCVADTLVRPLDYDEAALLHVSPGNCTKASALKHHFELWPNPTAEPACAFAGPRAPPTVVACAAAEFANRMARRASAGRGSTVICEDDKIWYTEDRVGKQMHELRGGEVVFHEACEGTDGAPSALVRRTKDGGRAVFCFNCDTTSFEVPTWRPNWIAWRDDVGGLCGALLVVEGCGLGLGLNSTVFSAGGRRPPGADNAEYLGGPKAPRRRPCAKGITGVQHVRGRYAGETG